MATFNLFHEFGKDLHNGVHNFGSHTFRVALTNSAPAQDTTALLADITQIAAGNGYTTVADGAGTTIALTVAETSAGSGVWRLGTSSSDCVFTASGGSIGPFRYAVIVNDTPTSPLNPLVGYLDYGSNIPVTDGNTFTIDAGANGWYEYTVPAAV